MMHDAERREVCFRVLGFSKKIENLVDHVHVQSNKSSERDNEIIGKRLFFIQETPCLLRLGGYPSSAWIQDKIQLCGVSS